tara:strand:- start:780 stop:1376 length:597 start_codon:yes stop_codon:yes gene_type:complete
MSKKLKNIKAVTEMLSGEHKTQTKKTVSFDKGEFVKRTIGDTWVDTKNQQWEQKDGYKVKVGKFSKLREELKSFPNCNKETCVCIEPSQADLKMKAYHGMCLDCVVDTEHELKLNGEYDQYEKKKILSNAESWLKQAEIEKDIVKASVNTKFINEDGSIEDWNGVNPEDVSKQIEDGFEKFKTTFIDELKKEIEIDEN